MQPTEREGPAHDRPWSRLFFVVNFGLATLFAVMCVSVIVPPAIGAALPSPFAWPGAIVLLWPALAVAWAEWQLYLGDAYHLERRLGIFCCVLAGLVAFGFIANVSEALRPPPRDMPPDWEPPGVVFWTVFTTICATLSAYGFWCGLTRLRRAPRPIDRRDQLLKDLAR